jgi:hypothetical protein
MSTQSLCITVLHPDIMEETTPVDLRAKGMSYGAIGVLFHMARRPEQNWTVAMLRKASPDSEETLWEFLWELRNTGYIDWHDPKAVDVLDLINNHYKKPEDDDR